MGYYDVYTKINFQCKSYQQFDENHHINKKKTLFDFGTKILKIMKVMKSRI